MDPSWYLLAPAALVAVLLLIRAAFRGRKTANRILVDGSNVMHWNGPGNGRGADINVVRGVVRALSADGYEVGVIFDANAGYKIANRYMNEGTLARLLRLKKDQVMVVPKGQPADGFLLLAAREMDAPIVTNDRFRDWRDAFPESADPGRLVRGDWRNGAPILHFSKDAPR